VSGKSVPVVLVGDDKVREQQALGKLTHVVLREAGVSIIGPSLGSVCPKVREVDLQGNLLHSWGEVAELGRSLPLLRVLNLSDNALPPLTEGLAADLAGCLPSLRTLIVSDTPLDWPSLMRLCKLAPGLEELHATGCGFSELTPTPAVFNAGDATVSACEGSFLAADVFPRVKTLNLSGNPLPWEQIFALARMPCLSWLLLNDCKLTEVWTSSTPLGDAITSAPATGGGGGSTTLPPFPLLEQLSLAGSAITASWVLDALDSFPSLRSVRLTNGDFSLPLHPPLGPVEARQVVIARCPRITSLCGSEVRLREREDAEKAYARRVAGLWGESRGLGAAGLTEVFGTHTVGPQPEFNLLAPPPNSPGNAATATTTLTMGIPAGFSKGSDAGIIRARGGEFVLGGAEGFFTSSNPFIRSPVPLISVSAPSSSSSSTAATVYCTPLDPWGLGAKDPSAAASLQAAFPRFFLLAAKFDLLAPGKAGSGGLAGGTLASSSVPLLLRSMAGGSCMMDPVPRRLPLATTVHDVKIMAGKLFKCQVSLQRLSFRENSASYPSLMDDDQRPLSYYGVCADGEILVEEVDPAGEFSPPCFPRARPTHTLLTRFPRARTHAQRPEDKSKRLRPPKRQKLLPRRPRVKHFERRRP